MSEPLQLFYSSLPFVWLLIYVAAAVVSFVRLRTTLSGLILGTAFSLRAVTVTVSFIAHTWVFKVTTMEDYTSPRRVIATMILSFGIPALLLIATIIGVALIPRSLRQLAARRGEAMGDTTIATPGLEVSQGAARQPGDFNLGLALGEGWQAVTRHLGVAIGAVLIYLVLDLIGSFIPFVNILYMLLIMGPFTAGLAILGLKLVDGKQVSVGDVFGGFSQFGRYLGAFWLIFLICIAVELVAVIPVGATLAVAAGLEDSGSLEAGDPTFVLLVALGALVTLALLVIGLALFVVPYTFTMFVIADQRDKGSAVEAFRESARLAKGKRWRIAGSVLLLSLIATAGMIALCVGYLITAPWMMCAMASIYRQLAGPKTADSGVIHAEPATAAF